MPPLLLGLLSAISFGAGNAYWKKAARSVPLPYLLLYRGMLAVMLLGMLWILLSFTHTDLAGMMNTKAGWKSYLLALAICLFCALGLPLFLQSLRFQSLWVTTALSGVNIFSILSAVWLVGESFRPVYYLCFLLALCGSLLALTSGSNLRVLSWNKGGTYALAASFVWGISYPLFKFVAPAIGGLPLSFLLEGSVTLMSWGWIGVQRRNGSIPTGERYLSKRYRVHYAFLGLSVFVGTLSFNLALEQLPVLSLNLLSNLQLLITALLGALWYRERVTMFQTMGLLLILLAAFLAQQG